MAIYTIGDLHLSLRANKPMDIFKGWDNYIEKIKQNWMQTVQNDDTVVLVGDTSWEINLEDTLLDFQLLESLPGRKIIIKGNHDYWWSSAAKMSSFFAQNNLNSLNILHNNSFVVEDVAVCGSRGWLFENGQPHDEKIVRRECIRIEASIKSAPKDAEKILFLHYPPIYAGQILQKFFDIMAKHGINRCYYGHIHGAGHKHAFQGVHDGVKLNMISSDYLGFSLAKVK